jgi:hypothetical protein
MAASFCRRALLRQGELFGYITIGMSHQLGLDPGLNLVPTLFFEQLLFEALELCLGRTNHVAGLAGR